MGDAFITRKGGGGLKLETPEITYVATGNTYVQFKLTNMSSITGNVYYTLNWDEETDISEWALTHAETSGIVALSDISLEPENISDTITISGLAEGDYTLTAILYLTSVLQSEAGEYLFEGLTGVLSDVPTFSALTQNTFYASGINITNTNTNIPLELEYIITTTSSAPAAYSYSEIVNPSAALNVRDIPITQGGTYYFHARLVDGTILGSNASFGPYTSPKIIDPTWSYEFDGSYVDITFYNENNVDLTYYYEMNDSTPDFAIVVPANSSHVLNDASQYGGTFYVYSKYEVDQQVSNTMSGIVNVPVSATGGTITSSGEYTVHTFNSSGVFSVTRGGRAIAYIIGGGGSGGNGGNNNGGGGGGGGGLSYNASVVLADNTNYIVTVGSGGSRPTTSISVNGNNGGTSSFVGTNVSMYAYGGSGGIGGDSTRAGGSGGTANGGTLNATGGAGGAGGEANSGSDAPTNSTGSPGGGGGGGGNSEGGLGSNGNATYYTGGGAGGSGDSSTNSRGPGNGYYSGGTGAYNNGSGGQPGGGPYGGIQGVTGSNRLNNGGGGGTYGAGGGGGGDYSNAGGTPTAGAGSKGVVIIKYLTNV